jgi:hypothetical protein
VIGSAQPSWMGPKGSSVPSSAAMGPPKGSLLACSLSDTCRVFVAGPSDVTAGSLKLAFAESRLLSWLTRGTTANFTWPVVPGSAAGKSPPPKGSSGPSLMGKSSVPTENPVKSTMTSARSAGAMRSPDGACLGPGRRYDQGHGAFPS